MPLAATGSTCRHRRRGAAPIPFEADDARARHDLAALDARLRRRAVAPASRALHLHPAGLDRHRRRSQPPPRRRAVRRLSTHEDSVMEERRFHPLDYLSVLSRRKWWFIVPLVRLHRWSARRWRCCCRAKYQSQAEIGIADPDAVAGAAARRAVAGRRGAAARRLAAAAEPRPCSSASSARSSISPAKPVEETAACAARQGRGQHRGAAADRPHGRPDRDGIESFRLGYVDASPERAQRIANRLATVFVEENSQDQDPAGREHLGGARAAAARQPGAADRAQEQLRVKKQANMGRLPDQMNANIQMVNGLRAAARVAVAAAAHRAGPAVDARRRSSSRCSRAPAAPA